MRFSPWAAALGFIGVALGAFGAHALKKHVGPEELAIWSTAVKYQFVHALALLGVDFALWVARDLGREEARAPLGVAGYAFIIGAVLFSGSLYALVGTGVRKLGMVTPLGGLSFLVGWAAFGWATWKLRA